MDTVNIKIVKATDPKVWYAKFIGETYTATMSGDRYPYREFYVQGKRIDFEDAVIIREKAASFNVVNNTGKVIGVFDDEETACLYVAGYTRCIAEHSYSFADIPTVVGVN